MPNLLLGMGAIFLAFALADLLFYPEEVRLALFFADAGSGLVLGFTGVLANQRGISPRWAHPTMALAGGIITANSCFGMVTGAEPLQSIYLVLLVIGCGAILLSWRWNLAVSAYVFASWMAIATIRGAFDWNGVQYALGLFAACLASVLICGLRIRLFHEAERARARLEEVANRAPVALFTLDKEGVFTFVKGKVAPDDLVGRSIFEWHPNAEDVAMNVRRALAGETFTAAAEINDRSLLISYGPLVTGEGAVSGVVGVATDVTERSRAERELEASRKHMARQERLASLGTLVAGVAHEINNPLAFIRGNTQLLRDMLQLLEESPNLAEDEKRDIRDAVSLVGSSLEGIDRLAHISESLRSVARGGNGLRSLEDVNMVARMSLTVARPRLGKTLAVTEDLAAERAVLADRGELGQVVLNLLINAGDELAGKSDARVTIRSFDQGPNVVIEIEDNGRGVAPDKAPLIFVPFVTTKTNGTGLGLSISHRIMTDHGGVLSFVSAPGRTVFRMELPAATIDEATLASPSQVSSLPPPEIRR